MEGITLTRETKVYKACPCLFRVDNKYVCLNSEDFPEVVLMPLGEDAEFIPLGEKGICYNAVVAGEDGYIHCPSTGDPIMIKGSKVRNEFFDETYRLAKVVFKDVAACTECLYKMLLSDVSEKELTILLIGGGATLEHYRKRLSERMKTLFPDRDILVVSGRLLDGEQAQPSIILKKGSRIVKVKNGTPIGEVEKIALKFLNE